MKDWEDIIKERQLSRKAELPESDWNDFLSRQAEHERAARRRRKLITLFISVPAAAAVLLLLFLMPFKTIVPDNHFAQNESSEPQVLADSIVNTVDSIIIEEKPQLEIAQVKPQPKPEVKAQIKRESKQQSKQESKPEEKPDANPEIRTGAVEDVRYGAASQGFGAGLFAQELSVKGSVYDFDSAEPLNYASVQIYRISGTDSTYIGGTSTGDDGSFIINNLEPGNYVARTTYLGFNNADKNFTIRSGSSSNTTDLGKITMRGNRMLAEVAVNPLEAKVHMVNDTVMFNSAAFKLPDSSSVEELISRLPGVKIDSDGNLTVNGKSVSRILVNGKEFFDDEKTVALTELSAEMIEKVKAYEKNSDLSRQTGIDDAREATVLDLPVYGKIIKGSVSDFDSAEPLDNASVEIYRVTRKDTTLICTTMTGKDGSFVIYNLKRGKYVARVSLNDYKTVKGRFKIGSGSHTYDIGKIALTRVDILER